MLAKAGAVVNIHLRPHDLRRHAATFASRSGVPLEIVSKIIFRHANLSTTERYLGKIAVFGLWEEITLTMRDLVDYHIRNWGKVILMAGFARDLLIARGLNFFNPAQRLHFR